MGTPSRIFRPGLSPLFFHTWKQPTWTNFTASPIDTAKSPENQRLEKKQVGSPKRTLYETSANFHKWKYEHMKTRGFASYKHGKATRKPEIRDETRRNTKTSISHDISFNFLHLIASKPIFSYEFSQEPEILLPQNRYFERGFFHFEYISENSTPITESAPCRHMTSPANACNLKKNLQHNISKILYPPYKITITISKVLRLPRKLQFIL